MSDFTLAKREQLGPDAISLIRVSDLHRKRRGKSPQGERRARTSMCPAQSGRLHIRGLQIAFSKGLPSIVEQNDTRLKTASEGSELDFQKIQLFPWTVPAFQNTGQGYYGTQIIPKTHRGEIRNACHPVKNNWACEEPGSTSRVEGATHH